MKKQHRGPRSPIGGSFPGEFHDSVGEYRVCTVDGCEIRVWGAANGRGLPSALVAALRRIVRTTGPARPIALMADHHPSVNGVVGSVVVSSELVSPALIGGDCGCGVYAERLGCGADALAPAVLRQLYSDIVQRVPSGRAQHTEPQEDAVRIQLWERLLALSWISRREIWKLKRQMATLGGGNHFLEVAACTAGDIWVLVHSGSRYLGGLFAAAYADRRLTAESEELSDFFVAQSLVVAYAAESRRRMAVQAREALASVYRDAGADPLESFDSPHNFVELREGGGERLFVHRKGACAADAGRTGVVPGSMAAGSYVVTGRGNPASYWSASHGAGRAMSRGEAFRTLSTRQLRREMEGIVWAESDRLKDEAPAAYKPLDAVMRSQSALVAIRTHLRPLLVVKGV